MFDPFSDETSTSTSLIQSAIRDMHERQRKIKEDQDSLLNKNQIAYEDQPNISGDVLARQARDDLSNDQNYFSHFNASYTSSHQEEQNRFHYAIKTHKMSQVCEGTLDLFGEEEEAIVQIASGRLPRGISNEINEKLPVLDPQGYEERFWGTSNVTFLSCAIASVYFTLYGKKISLEDSIDSSIIFFNIVVISLK